MKIALLGYGKMGKTIERIAIERGHEIVAKIDFDNASEKESLSPANVDVVIEFSSPHSAYENLKFCMKKGLKTVCGTTGWLDHRAEIEQLCQENKAAFFYASNYSIGVNLFFKLNQTLAKLISPYDQYKLEMTEIHHTEKLDSPSGTAITLAEGIIQNNANFQKWAESEDTDDDTVKIIAKREGKVPGTHIVSYQSAVDTIEISHTAHSREGFALGAVVAAEWLSTRTGVLGMDDMIQV